MVNPEWTSKVKNRKQGAIWEGRSSSGKEITDNRSGLTRNREILGRMAHASVLVKADMAVPLCRARMNADEEQAGPEETGLGA